MTSTARRDGVFITGTDTEIGKTYASVALMRAWQHSGAEILGMKPVAAGCDETPDGRRNEDAVALAAASSRALPYELINPIALASACSPHLAAAREGSRIELEAIRRSFDALRERQLPVLVEGAGGWLAPLSEDARIADLAQSLKLPVIMVVGMRLGCLNHALLSARSIIADGCELLGWVANVCAPDFADLDENIAYLERHMPAPRLASIAHGGDWQANPAATQPWEA